MESRQTDYIEPSQPLRDITKDYRETAYDHIASWYDHWYENHWSSTKPFKTIIKILEHELKHQNNRVSDPIILDVACGTGNTYVAFKRAGYAIYGTDGSEQMLMRALENCKVARIPDTGIIIDRINWTDSLGYRSQFPSRRFDIVLNTANSFCHVPPLPEYMGLALANFADLLNPGGLLIIDTKKFIKEGDIEGVPFYKELKFEDPEWIIRTERYEDRDTAEWGKILFHTKLHYDIDPSFSVKVMRALIVLTIYGECLTPQTTVIPYYPLPAKDLARYMSAAGFSTTIYPAKEGLADDWRYDIVVGRKLS